MKLPLQVTVRDIEHSDALDADIRERVEKLERFYPSIMSCRVVAEMPHKHHHQGKRFNVRIDIGVPGGEIVVNRDFNEDIFVSLRDAFDAAKRQLEDYGRKQRGATKSHEPTGRGRVTRLFPEEGYGFIETADGRELYFSRENMVNVDFQRLQSGEEVQFLEEMAQEGLQAKRVSVGKHHGAQ